MTSRRRQRATAAPRPTGVTTFLSDLRHAARALRHHPGFLVVVVLTLGFGIGINTATFSIVNAVLIRPLPFDQPGRLVALTERVPGRAGNTPFSPPDFIDVQREQQSFDGIAAYRPGPAELSGSGAPVRLDVTRVSWNLFDVPRGPSDAGTRVHRARGPAGRGRGRAQLRSVGDAIWSRPIDHRPHGRARSQAVHGCRRDAARVQLPVAWPWIQRDTRRRLGPHGVCRHAAAGTRQRVHARRCRTAEDEYVDRRGACRARGPGATRQRALPATAEPEFLDRLRGSATP